MYNRESDSIFRYSLFRVSDRELAIDLTQEVFMRYWDQIVKGVKIKNDKAFLFAIVNRLIIDWYRKKKPVSLEAYYETFELDEFDISDGVSATELESRSDGRALLDRINDLDPAYRQALYLRYVEDMKPQEIGEILGLSPNVVSVRISRGVDELRRRFHYRDDHE